MLNVYKCSFLERKEYSSFHSAISIGKRILIFLTFQPRYIEFPINENESNIYTCIYIHHIFRSVLKDSNETIKFFWSSYKRGALWKCVRYDWNLIKGLKYVIVYPWSPVSLNSNSSFDMYIHRWKKTVEHPRFCQKWDIFKSSSMVLKNTTFSCSI